MNRGCNLCEGCKQSPGVLLRALSVRAYICRGCKKLRKLNNGSYLDLLNYGREQRGEN